MNRKLGKLPARPNAVALKFSTFFNAAALPTPPAEFGHYSVGASWGMLGNDQYGDCVLAGAAHETMVWAFTGGKRVVFDETCVLADYSALTGFTPSNPASDQGTDMQQAASYRRKVGVEDMSGNRHLIDSYVAIDAGRADELALAVYLTGAAGVGLNLPSSAEDQFDKGQPWTVVPGATIEGGHYVPCVGRNSDGNYLVVTWGRLHAMTPKFYETYCDEALAYVSIEALRNNLSPEGFDAEKLRGFLAAINQMEAVVAEPTVTKTAPTGVKIDTGEIDAAQIALRDTLNASGYGTFVSDAQVRSAAVAVVTAIEKYRIAPSI